MLSYSTYVPAVDAECLLAFWQHLASPQTHFQHVCAAAVAPPSVAHRYVSLLRLLRLGRAYRLYSWVKLMTYNQTLSLLAVTLARNFAVSSTRHVDLPGSCCSPVMPCYF